ncbi:MAG TPA: GNAT family N-acetyltransferase [Chloroflexota bacterium]|nr:GNAT family N-acetyltransferase [Chloroflexota bacterium]
MEDLIGGDWQEVLRVVRAVLAADCACSEQAFLDDSVVFVPWEEREGRRRFPLQLHRLTVMTMGTGVVVSCDAERVARLQAQLGQIDRDGIFSVETIARLGRDVAPDGPVTGRLDLKYACAGANLRLGDVPDHVEIAVVDQARIPELFRHEGFAHALSYRTETPRPDVIATVANGDGEIVGIAAASADCDRLWQIGVDVVTSARGRGIGRALVSHLTREVLRQGRIPYYSTTVANLRSRGLALGVGYRPCWVELDIRAKQPQEPSPRRQTAETEDTETVV